MALVRQCDRCGKTFDHMPGVGGRNALVMAKMSLGSDGNFEYYTNDIKQVCPDCMESFKEWFEKLGRAELEEV